MKYYVPDHLQSRINIDTVTDGIDTMVLFQSVNCPEAATSNEVAISFIFVMFILLLFLGMIMAYKYSTK